MHIEEPKTGSTIPLNQIEPARARLHWVFPIRMMGGITTFDDVMAEKEK
jgi:hypothetical protein